MWKVRCIRYRKEAYANDTMWNLFNVINNKIDVEEMQ